MLLCRSPHRKLPVFIFSTLVYYTMVSTVFVCTYCRDLLIFSCVHKLLEAQYTWLTIYINSLELYHYQYCAQLVYDIPIYKLADEFLTYRCRGNWHTVAIHRVESAIPTKSLKLTVIVCHKFIHWLLGFVNYTTMLLVFYTDANFCFWFKVFSRMKAKDVSSLMGCFIKICRLSLSL